MKMNKKFDINFLLLLLLLLLLIDIALLIELVVVDEVEPVEILELVVAVVVEEVIGGPTILKLVCNFIFLLLDAIITL